MVGASNISSMVCRWSRGSDDLLTFWGPYARRRSWERLEAEFDVYLVRVSKKKKKTNGDAQG